MATWEKIQERVLYKYKLKIPNIKITVRHKEKKYDSNPSQFLYLTNFMEAKVKIKKIKLCEFHGLLFVSSRVNFQPHNKFLVRVRMLVSSGDLHRAVTLEGCGPCRSHCQSHSSLYTWVTQPLERPCELHSKQLSE